MVGLSDIVVLLVGVLPHAMTPTMFLHRGPALRTQTRPIILQQFMGGSCSKSASGQTRQYNFRPANVTVATARCKMSASGQSRNLAENVGMPAGPRATKLKLTTTSRRHSRANTIVFRKTNTDVIY
jgi:hypothetical protein